MSSPLALHEIEAKIAEISTALSALVADHETATHALAEAEAAFDRKYHAKRAELYLGNPKTRVDMVESIAKTASADEYDALVIAKQREAFVRHAMRAYSSVLSAYQTTGKFAADEAGHARYGRR